jgi:hypothetical protein
MATALGGSRGGTATADDRPLRTPRADRRLRGSSFAGRSKRPCTSNAFSVVHERLRTRAMFGPAQGVWSPNGPHNQLVLGVVRPPCDHRQLCPSRMKRSTSGAECACLASRAGVGSSSRTRSTSGSSACGSPRRSASTACRADASGCSWPCPRRRRRRQGHGTKSTSLSASAGWSPVTQARPTVGTRSHPPRSCWSTTSSIPLSSGSPARGDRVTRPAGQAGIGSREPVATIYPAYR